MARHFTRLVAVAALALAIPRFASAADFDVKMLARGKDGHGLPTGRPEDRPPSRSASSNVPETGN